MRSLCQFFRRFSGLYTNTFNETQVFLRASFEKKPLFGEESAKKTHFFVRKVKFLSALVALGPKILTEHNEKYHFLWEKLFFYETSEVVRCLGCPGTQNPYRKNKKNIFW